MAILVKDDNGDFVPQHLSPDGTVYYKTKGNQYGGQFITPINNNGDELFTNTTPGNVQIIGNKAVEQLTDANASSGTLTFTDNVQAIGIYNRDTVNDGVFNVNGINITVPKNTSVDFNIGGTPSNIVTITGSTTYIVTRYV